jgi:CRP/FNR family transcriptional regulator, cyclic AMP receptor protein
MNRLLEPPAKRKEPESMATRVAFHPFLAGMNPTQLVLLTDCAIPVRFNKGQTILREGEMANRFYLIESGKVVLESDDRLGEPVIVETIGAGDLLGWSWMFPPYVWHFTARAIEQTEAIFFYGTILREYCERDPSLGYELFKRMTPVMMKRLQAARKRMVQVCRKEPRPVVLESPFLDQEQDVIERPISKRAGTGAASGR